MGFFQDKSLEYIKFNGFASSLVKKTCRFKSVAARCRVDQTIGVGVNNGGHNKHVSQYYQRRVNFLVQTSRPDLVIW